MSENEQEVGNFEPTPADFDAFGIFRDSQGRPILARIRCGEKYIYRYLPDMPEMYLWMNTALWYKNVPNAWSGDYFVDSNVKPIMFRYRTASGKSGDVCYQRIVSADMMTAVLNEDEAAQEKCLAEDEKKHIADTVAESVHKKRMEEGYFITFESPDTKRSRVTTEDTPIINE